MSYYIKKTNLKKGLYLQIYEGHHDPIKGHTVSTLYRKLGYLNDLIASGLEDPITHFQKEVDDLNRRMRADKTSKRRAVVGESSPERNIGYVLLKRILERLDVKRYMDLYQSIDGYQFNAYETMSAMVFARVIKPCSKRATFHDVLPLLMKDYEVSYGQMLECCSFLGSEYEKFVELFTAMTAKVYGISTDRCYFDCTNFYFEIDREDELRRKGPSKENRHDPIIGLGLLLDSDMVPIGMRMYSGNESEKPVMRAMIDDMKKRGNITGRTVQVADKGLNCANNIVKALLDGDGYIFSRSVRTLSDKELEWVFLPDGWTDVCDDDGEVVYRYKECMDDFEYFPTDEEILSRLGNKSAKVGEKRVLTYNSDLARKQIAEIDRMVEKASNLCLSKAKRAEFGDAAKYIVFKGKSKDSDEMVYARVDIGKAEEDKKLCGYNLIVTSEHKMKAVDIYSAYHRLWRIEESFRVMKSELDSRPVFLQRPDCILGHFFICYVSVLLIRLLQIKILDDKWSVQSIVSLIRELKAVKLSQKSYLNLARKSEILDCVCQKFSLPLNSLLLDHKDVSALDLK